MKNKLFFLLVIVIGTWSCNNSESLIQPVNSVIGDRSFLNKFGNLPNKFTDENLRIKTHLEYVEQLLRKANTENLTGVLKTKRNFLINKLHEYWTAERFPKNYDYNYERKPCFIDKDGNICAVGYLIEQISGRLLAEKVNQNHKYDKISEMNSSEVIDWIKNSGLTVEECAMIQPAYGYPDASANSISTAYGIGGSMLMGLNVSLCAVNLGHIFKGTDNKVVPAVGLLSGAGSVTLGIANIDGDNNDLWGNTKQNLYKNTFSFVNIGIGTAAMTLSIINLLSNKQKKDKNLSWTFYSFPGESYSAGVHVVKRF